MEEDKDTEKWDLNRKERKKEKLKGWYRSSEIITIVQNLSHHIFSSSVLISPHPLFSSFFSHSKQYCFSFLFILFTWNIFHIHPYSSILSYFHPKPSPPSVSEIFLFSNNSISFSLLLVWKRRRGIALSSLSLSSFLLFYNLCLSLSCYTLLSLSSSLSLCTIIPLCHYSSFRCLLFPTKNFSCERQKIFYCCPSLSRVSLTSFPLQQHKNPPSLSLSTHHDLPH